jgi:hypothetical protein
LSCCSSYQPAQQLLLPYKGGRAPAVSIRQERATEPQCRLCIYVLIGALRNLHFLSSNLILVRPSQNRHRVFLILGEQKMDCRPYEPLRRACRAIETDIKTLFLSLSSLKVFCSTSSKYRSSLLLCFSLLRAKHRISVIYLSFFCQDSSE